MDGSISAVLQHVRRLAAVEAGRDLSDSQLLERFRCSRDESAFAVLLHRHGPMVWRLCQRVLRHRQDTEDVFQATFLTLAKKAAAIRNQASIAGWLHRVAYRMARRLQAERGRKPEPQPTHDTHEGPADQASDRELRAALDEELEQLAEKHRLPLVLCYLQGRTRDEAAERLGWSLGTFKRRLERARKLLAARLTRRGVTLGIALCSALVAPDAVSAMVRPTLIWSTCEAATLIASGRAAALNVSTQVLALSEGVIKAMALSKLKLAATLVLVVATLAGGASFWSAHSTPASQPALARAEPALAKTGTKLAGDPQKSDERAQPVDNKGAQEDLDALVTRGDYLVNRVARCGDCHTSRLAKGGPDLTRHLQGADLWFGPKGKARENWESEAPDITASGRAGKWTQEKMVKFLSTGEKAEAPMPAYQLSLDDARAVTAYLRSLPGKTSKGTSGKDKKR